MRRTCMLVFAAALALPLGAAHAAGPTSGGGATALSPAALPREVRITVPVEISNYPSRVFHPGAGPTKVTCVLYVGDANGTMTAVLPIGSAVVPFDPKLGTNSYQGSVTVVLNMPPGNHPSAMYICQIVDPATDGMPLNKSASVTEISSPFTP